MKHKVIGIRFKKAGKKYYFDPLDFDFSVGDKAVVETVRGIEVGEVVEDAKMIDDEALISTLKSVLRVATAKDIEQYKKNQADVPDVLKTTSKLIRKHALEMKLLDAEYTLDRSKLIIYFTAEGRVDFRDLVKDLANAFRVRIELRQVGARDGAKFLGGIGPCGLLLCCNTFLGEFNTVSIKMAKNQNLSLNPGNISGLCGKLLCCIRYENDTYHEYRAMLPKENTVVKTKDGKGTVIATNVIDLSAKVILENNNIRHYNVDELETIQDGSSHNKKA